MEKNITSTQYYQVLPEEKITISLEEYKQLLIIKGKYEELKSQKSVTQPFNPTKITYAGPDGKPIDLTPPYKVTC
jgi:hypothetical protein